MDHLTMFDVGDKQHLLYEEQDSSAIIDIGGSVLSKHIKTNVYYNATSLVISHFHKDHYDELLTYAFQSSSQALQNISNLYLPIIITDNAIIQQLYTTIIAHQFVMQYKNRSPFLKSFPIDAYITCLVAALTSQQTLTIYARHQGNTIKMGTKVYDVLWPNLQALNAMHEDIKKVLDEFNYHYAQDLTMSKAIKKVSPFVHSLTTSGTATITIDKKRVAAFLANYPKDAFQQPITEYSGFSQEQTKVNAKLAKLANHLCLAFRNDKWLFLGDLESTDLREVMNYLYSNNWLKKYKLIVTPHHGTHCHKTMLNLQSDICVASMGTGLYNTQKEQTARPIFNAISCNNYKATLNVGTIILNI